MIGQASHPIPVILCCVFMTETSSEYTDCREVTAYKKNLEQSRIRPGHCGGPVTFEDFYRFLRNHDVAKDLLATWTAPL